MIMEHCRKLCFETYIFKMFLKNVTLFSCYEILIKKNCKSLFELFLTNYEKKANLKAF